MLKKMNYKLIGEYKYFSACRFCGSEKVKSVINLGVTPLAGGFINQKDLNGDTEKFYPLDLNFCQKCFLLQVNISINPDILFKKYFYFSSSIKTLTDHFNQNAKEFSEILDKKKNRLVVEIGSNDGSFLEAMSKEQFRAIGVDPSNVAKSAIKKGLNVINDYFTFDIALKIVKKHGKADLIFSSNTLAHIEDMHDVFLGISRLLREDGILIFEVHYLAKLIKKTQYDMIYHEHQYYYTLLSLRNFLRKFDLEIYDAKEIPIHGGSIQIYVKKLNNKIKKTKRLAALIKKERQNRLDKTETYLEFNRKINLLKISLLKEINALKSKGKSIVGYGASGRASTMINYCGINSDVIDYVIDDAPAKIRSFMPGTHQKIISSKILNSKNRPDYVLLFAWSYINEIRSRNVRFIERGGKFIVPLPKVRVV